MCYKRCRDNQGWLPENQKLWVMSIQEFPPALRIWLNSFFNFNINWKLNMQGRIKRIKQVVNHGRPQVLRPKGLPHKDHHPKWIPLGQPNILSNFKCLGSVSATSQDLTESAVLMTNEEQGWGWLCEEHPSSVAHNLLWLQIWKISYSPLMVPVLSCVIPPHMHTWCRPLMQALRGQRQVELWIKDPSELQREPRVSQGSII